MWCIMSSDASWQMMHYVKCCSMSSSASSRMMNDVMWCIMWCDDSCSLMSDVMWCIIWCDALCSVMNDVMHHVSSYIMLWLLVSDFTHLNLTVCLYNGQTDIWMDRQINWLIEFQQVINWLINRSTDWFIDWLSDWTSYCYRISMGDKKLFACTLTNTAASKQSQAKSYHGQNYGAI